MHDFCLISLSDLMTPWEKIEKRLRAAGEADFVLCLYNPSSHKRKDYLRRACEILLESKSPDTPCGYVREIGRAGETATVLTLGNFATPRWICSPRCSSATAKRRSSAASW